MNSRIVLERQSIEGDRPVSEILIWTRWHLSTAEHVEFCGNLPEPSGKAKYYLVTDSEQVP